MFDAYKLLFLATILLFLLLVIFSAPNNYTHLLLLSSLIPSIFHIFHRKFDFLRYRYVISINAGHFRFIIFILIMSVLLGREDESPIPLKPALARSATRRPTNKKVPPITAHSEKFISSNEDDVDSAYAASLESTLEAESHSEVNISVCLVDYIWYWCFVS